MGGRAKIGGRSTEPKAGAVGHQQKSLALVAFFSASYFCVVSTARQQLRRGQRRRWTSRGGEGRLGDRAALWHAAVEAGWALRDAF